MAHTPPQITAHLAEDLTERELDVLRLKALNRSNQDIADELVLALSTVKWYVRQIYGKLGVTNRRQAVARAQALGLIEGSPSPGKHSRHNLPAQTTPFIGREQELADLDALLFDPHVRLVTILAPGGMGKTRLGLAVAEAYVGSFADGVYLVPLTPLRSPDQIMMTIAEALSFPFLSDDRSFKQQVLDFLRHKQMLLLLDNFEHLLDGAGLVVEILQVAPSVRIIVTSRQRLNLSSEAVYTVSGLPFPESESSGDVLDYEAVWLFIQRAELASPGFELHPDQLPFLARICRLVEGMPLGIVLAAAWTEVLSLEEIADEIERSFDFLAAERPDEPRRQWSIRAVFDPTWNRLTEQERAVFTRFSVFRGGCTREAAQAVTEADLRTLQALINKALLERDPMGRYRIHELLRQYAAEKLNQAPDVKVAVLNRHCAYYTELLHRQEQTIHLSNQSGVLTDLDNIRVAWMHAVQQRDLAALQRAAHGLYWLWHFQNRHDEGAAMFGFAEEALREMQKTDDVRFLLGMMQLFRYYFRHEPSDLAAHPSRDIDAALALWDGLEERPEMGLPLTRAMLTLGSRLGEPGQVIAAARKNLAFSQRHNDLSSAAISLTTLASISFEALGDFDEARQLLDEALTIDRQIGFDLNAGWSRRILAQIASFQGQYAEAREHLEASVEHRRAAGILSALDTLFIALGNAALETGDDVAAQRYFAEGIAVANNFQRHDVIAHGRAGLGLVAAFRGDLTAATALLEDIYAYLRSAGTKGLNSQESDSLGILALLLDYHEQALAYYEAILSTFANTDYRVPLMQCHSRAGHALIGLNNRARAESYLFDAFREAATIGAWQILLEALLGMTQLSVVQSQPALAVELLALIGEHPASNRYSRTCAERVLSLMRTETRLSQDDFTSAIERGQALTLEAAVALVEPFHMKADKTPLTDHQRSPDSLSQRELDVLELMAEGLTNHEIADRLYIGVSTVKKHINHIYGKLDVTHRARAVARARTLNLLS